MKNGMEAQIPQCPILNMRTIIVLILGNKSKFFHASRFGFKLIFAKINIIINIAKFITQKCGKKLQESFSMISGGMPHNLKSGRLLFGD